MLIRRCLVFIALLPILTGCMLSNADVFLEKKQLKPDALAYKHCYGYGCQYTADITLTQTQIKTIKSLFQNNISAEQERQNIKRSIALFEKISGEQSGTDKDKGGTFKELSQSNHQLDCVDESLNTSIYLEILHQHNLLKFHAPLAPTSRLPLIHGGTWPHRSARILETDAQKIWAVDSWFHDNGIEPEIIPITLWMDGWKPNISQ